MLPKWKRSEKRGLGFFLKSPFLLSIFIYLSWPPEFPEPFLVIPTDRKGKIGTVLVFLLLQSQAAEQGLLKSVTRDERPC